ncbi:hypothetical protein K437DRAFT_104065 [Tilletiaria anomala UBC 951]|uniref:Uncharacterized protein n=1 Tax=Tilletiaria anomala (strain ATCC 24038 / CBS 436.72 / UBC 951) TaxID=1037660 RepID=A0A066VYH4_TILAU|nr:uncharacterized protein K437DRAFT_104065 [Tilletiaria anomala UBC 951]KDN46782.1 hypothetical protein K437DRAFT_104065 [Tilletiaria anomala UBC 951]
MSENVGRCSPLRVKPANLSTGGMPSPIDDSDVHLKPLSARQMEKQRAVEDESARKCQYVCSRDRNSLPVSPLQAQMAADSVHEKRAVRSSGKHAKTAVSVEAHEHISETESEGEPSSVCLLANFAWRHWRSSDGVDSASLSRLRATRARATAPCRGQASAPESSRRSYDADIFRASVSKSGLRLERMSADTASSTWGQQFSSLSDRPNFAELVIPLAASVTSAQGTEKSTCSQDEGQYSDHTTDESPKRPVFDLSKFSFPEAKRRHTPSSGVPIRNHSMALSLHMENSAAAVNTPSTKGASIFKASSKVAATSPLKRSHQVRANEPIHPLALDLSSIPSSSIKSLPKCPICLRSFPQSHKGPVRRKHIGSCAAEHACGSVDVVQGLVEQEHDRLRKVEAKRQLEKEAKLTVYQRLMQPRSRPSRATRMEKSTNGIFTTLKEAKVGHAQAQLAMAKLFASPLLNDLCEISRVNEEMNAEDLGSMPHDARVAKEGPSDCGPDNRKSFLPPSSKAVYSMYDFDYDEGAYYGGLQVGAPLIPADDTQRSHALIDTTDPSASAPASAPQNCTQPFGASKLATRQLSARRRLGLGLGQLANASNQSAAEAPMANAPALATTKLAIRAQTLPQCSTRAITHAASVSALPRAPSAIAKYHTTDDLQLYTVSGPSLGAEMDVASSRCSGHVSIAPLPTFNEDIRAISLTSMEEDDVSPDFDFSFGGECSRRVLVPCSQ